MVKLRSNHDPLRLRLLPLRLARARESHPAGHHPIQSDSAERPTTPGSFPPASSSRPRQPIPSALHSIRIPRQSCLHNILADGVPPCFRPPGSCVSSPCSLLSSLPAHEQTTICKYCQTNRLLAVLPTPATSSSTASPSSTPPSPSR